MALLIFRLLNSFQHYYSYRSGASASLLKSLFYSMEIFWYNFDYKVSRCLG